MIAPAAINAINATGASNIELCTGTVMHKRLRPVAHGFTYGVFFVRVPVALIDAASSSQRARTTTLRSPLWSINRSNLLSLQARDYGPRDGSSLETWARRLLVESEITAADGEIVLQAFPRVLGYVFNPISIWYCYDRRGALRAAICEVNNTFGERHNYVLAHEDERAIVPGDWLAARKVFHVSPFCEVRGHYRFRFEQTGARSFAQIDFYDGGGADDKLIVTTIAGSPSDATTGATIGALCRYPLMTLGVIARIHWQAFRLWRKRVPFFSKPHPPIVETTRFETIK